MKLLKKIALLSTLALWTACATTAKFPTSDAAPAALIKAKMTKDANKNNVIEVTAWHLAQTSRLNPPKKNYSVWIVAENGATKNLGQLIHENSKKASLSATTPFNVKEIFITAEDQGNLNYPVGVEISRTTFKK